jgi:hypothetical protein
MSEAAPLSLELSPSLRAIIAEAASIHATTSAALRSAIDPTVLAMASRRVSETARIASTAIDPSIRAQVRETLRLAGTALDPELLDSVTACARAAFADVDATKAMVMSGAAESLVRPIEDAKVAIDAPAMRMLEDVQATIRRNLPRPLPAAFLVEDDYVSPVTGIDVLRREAEVRRAQRDVPELLREILAERAEERRAARRRFWGMIAVGVAAILVTVATFAAPLIWKITVNDARSHSGGAVKSQTGVLTPTARHDLSRRAPLATARHRRP